MRGPDDFSSEVEEALLGGKFHSDPFRLVDLSDAQGSELNGRICFAVNRRKRLRADHGGRSDQKNLSTCCEVIGGGQFRALQGELRFERPPNGVPPSEKKRVGGFPALAAACNRFYLARLNAELSILEGLIAGNWFDDFRRMIESIQSNLDRSDAMLVRVGRHCGAESVTLDRRRWIQIRGGRGESHWARDATTIWLAADREDGPSDMLPFGWLLIEIGGTSAPGGLEEWCNQEGERVRQPSQVAATPSRSDRSAATGRSVMAQYRFHKGDRVTDRQEEAIVVSDVRLADTRMEVEYDDGEVRSVPVAGWSKVP
jgi:CRISPR-associated protein Csm5